MDRSQQFVELFAGVGGFRLGLEAAGWSAAWSNQWEPRDSDQWASRCYVQRFGEANHTNEDIAKVDADQVPPSRLLVAGFPCQDFSIANPTGQGLRGDRGQLWWEIVRVVSVRRPDFLLFENVDRLLRSPGWPLGADFWIILDSLWRLGYRVEWRVVNSAEYGFTQRRRRVFIVAARVGTKHATGLDETPASQQISIDGILARAFPTQPASSTPWRVTVHAPHHFGNSGTMGKQGIFASDVTPASISPQPIKQVLETSVQSNFYIDERQLATWRTVKGPKVFMRKGRDTKVRAITEGQVPFPDRINQPSRTILTMEGSQLPNRSTHVITDPETSRLRVLTPAECERLNGFPDAWTEGMPAPWRYRCMGNALVVGNVNRIGSEILARAD